MYVSTWQALALQMCASTQHKVTFYSDLGLGPGHVDWPVGQY